MNADPTRARSPRFPAARLDCFSASQLFASGLRSHSKLAKGQARGMTTSDVAMTAFRFPQCPHLTTSRVALFPIRRRTLACSERITRRRAAIRRQTLTIASHRTRIPPFRNPIHSHTEPIRHRTARILPHRDLNPLHPALILPHTGLIPPRRGRIVPRRALNRPHRRPIQHRRTGFLRRAT
jgi:hypothetical protein